MKFAKNICLNSDSYKYSQWVQYPAGTEYVYSYIESRGGKYDKLVFLGLQAFLREYMSTPVTRAMIDQAESIIKAHGEPFNREGWEYIIREHGGILPVEIKSVDEGTVMYLKNVLVSIVNTDPKCYWLTSFLETALLRAIWYPTTVASNSYHSKEIILEHLERTGDPSLIDFKLHDFGARGVSSLESAALGGGGQLPGRRTARHRGGASTGHYHRARGAADLSNRGDRAVGLHADVFAACADQPACRHCAGAG